MPNLREQTVVVLREALLNEEFSPGEKLVERTLATQTGVSRTSIREALSQLEAEGLVTRISGKGIFVAQISEEDAQQIYEARAILECAMARLYVERATEEDISSLAAAIAVIDVPNSPTEARLHAERFDAISDIIMKGADNGIIRQMASILRTRVTFLRTITARAATSGHRKSTIEMLKNILEAFKSRDADLADNLTRTYVERSAKFAIEVLKYNKNDSSRLAALKKES